MPAYGDLILPDGLATPANHTFSRMGREGLVVKWADRSIGARNAWWTVALTHVTTKAGLTKVRAKIVIPTLEAVGTGAGTGIIAVPGVAYNHGFDGTFFLPAQGTTQERAHLLALAKNLCINASFAGVVSNAEPIY